MPTLEISLSLREARELPKFAITVRAWTQTRSVAAVNPKPKLFSPQQVKL